MVVCGDSHFSIEATEEDFDKWIDMKFKDFNPKHWLLEDFTLRVWDADTTFEEVMDELTTIIKMMGNDRLENVCTISDYSGKGPTGLLTVDYNGKYIRLLDAELNIFKYRF